MTWALLGLVAAGCAIHAAPATTHRATADDGTKLLATLVYTGKAAILEGTVTFTIAEGAFSDVAKSLPYGIRHPKAAEHVNAYRGQRVIRLAADAQGSQFPHYYAETYLDAATEAPIRAVRWKREFPDTVFDFIAPGSVVLSKAGLRKPSRGARLLSMFSRKKPAGPEVDAVSFAEPIRVGNTITDFLTTFHRAPVAFARNVGSKAVRVFGIKKRMTSIYCATFTPQGDREVIELAINGEPTRREAQRFAWELSYVYPLRIAAGTSVESVRAKYLPERSNEDVRVLLHELTGKELAACVGDVVPLPVSPAVHTRVFGRSTDDGFAGPYGVSEAGLAWFDAGTGWPLRIKGGVYGFTGEVALTKVAGEYSKQLGLED